MGPVKNYSHAKQLPVAHRPSVFQSPDDDDEEEDYEQWLEIKGKLWVCHASFHLPYDSRVQSRIQSAVTGSAAHTCLDETVAFEQSKPPLWQALEQPYKNTSPVLRTVAAVPVHYRRLSWTRVFVN